MKVYVLLDVRTVGDWLDPLKVKEFEGVFETREAAEKVVMESFKKSETLIMEYEVKK